MDACFQTADIVIESEPPSSEECLSDGSARKDLGLKIWPRYIYI